MTRKARQGKARQGKARQEYDVMTWVFDSLMVMAGGEIAQNNLHELAHSGDNNMQQIQFDTKTGHCIMSSKYGRKMKFFLVSKDFALRQISILCVKRPVSFGWRLPPARGFYSI